MIKNILNLYNEVEHKTDFLLEAESEFDYSASTIKTHWVGGLKKIPEKFQERFHSFTLNWLKQERVRKSKRIRDNALSKTF